MAGLEAGRLRRGYGPIYRALSRCGDDLTPAGKLVLLNLLEHLGQNSLTWPPQSVIAKETGFSQRKVVDAVKELVENGFVHVRRVGRGMANSYEMDLEAIIQWAETPRRYAKSAHLDAQNLHIQTGTSRTSRSAAFARPVVRPVRDWSLVEDEADEEAADEAAVAAEDDVLLTHLRQAGIDLTPWVRNWFKQWRDRGATSFDWKFAIDEAAGHKAVTPKYVGRILNRLLSEREAPGPVVPFPTKDDWKA